MKIMESIYAIIQLEALVIKGDKMNLGAFFNIGNLGPIAKDNGIDVPCSRGYWVKIRMIKWDLTV